MSSVENLKEVSVQDKEGKWHLCKPMIATVRGGKAVIYVGKDGTEVKREPLARYQAREARKADDKETALDIKVTAVVEEMVSYIQENEALNQEWEALGEAGQNKLKASWAAAIKKKFTE